MSMIQIRNVPEGLHRELKARAARAGKTLSDYLLELVRAAAERPEPEVLLRRIRERSPVYPAESPADAVRAERNARAEGGAVEVVRDPGEVGEAEERSGSSP